MELRERLDALEREVRLLREYVELKEKLAELEKQYVYIPYIPCPYPYPYKITWSNEYTTGVPCNSNEYEVIS